MNETDVTGEKITLTAARTDIGKRADVFICEKTDLSRNSAINLLEAGNVTLRGKSVKKSYKTAEGDVFEIVLPEPEECSAEPENIPLDIVYEDDSIVVVNKPRGMVVHPAPGHANGTLVSALLYHCGDSLSDINGVIRPGIVHRIDRDTSGLIAVAKNNDAHVKLSEQLSDHSMARTYLAVVRGNLPDSGTVDAPIDRHPADRKKMSVQKGGRNAVTHYEALRRFEGGFTLAQLKLETGRTHQIRVHMAHIGHPVLFDPVYGAPTLFEKRHPHVIEGQCLHAARLSLVHPKSGERMEFEAPLPEDFSEVIRLLEEKK